MQLTEQLSTEFTALQLQKKQNARRCFWLFLALVTLFILHKMALPWLAVYPKLLQVVGCCLAAGLCWYFIKFERLAVRLQLLESAVECAENILTAITLSSYQQFFAELSLLAKQDHWIACFLTEKEPMFAAHRKQLTRDYHLALLQTDTLHNVVSIYSKIKQLKEQLPLIQVKNTLAAALNGLIARRTALQTQWAAAYAGFSWWNKLKYPEQQPLQELNKTIDGLSFLQTKLLREHHDDFIAIEQSMLLAEKNAKRRIAETAEQVKGYLTSADAVQASSQQLLERGFWFSALSIPVSVWNDVLQASNVYSTLRSVNSEYAGLSDSEIWWQTLFLPGEQLAGLAALTKGAYFEQLVADDFGGALHAHFNHADTDIIIDGVAYQIKATDSAAYIDTVNEGVPIIATSEIADTMQLIDGGYTNAELDHTIDLALGGSVVDLPDTTTDAILAGLGGLGIFATLRGINNAAEKISNGGDAAEAIFEGVGVAIEHTAMALVGLAETTYNALNSRPSRFIGRLVKKGAIGIGNKLAKY